MREREKNEWERFKEGHLFNPAYLRAIHVDLRYQALTPVFDVCPQRLSLKSPPAHSSTSRWCHHRQTLLFAPESLSDAL